MKRRGWNYDKFIKQFMYLALEPVGITIWARCYRKHVRFFFNSHFWCTEKNNNLDKCDIFLVFRGHRIFDDSRVMTTTEVPLYNDALAQAQAIIDKRELESNCRMLRSRQKNRQYRRTVDNVFGEDSGSTSSGKELDLENVMEDEKIVKNKCKHTYRKRKPKAPAPLDMRLTRSKSKKISTNNMQNIEPDPKTDDQNSVQKATEDAKTTEKDTPTLEKENKTVPNENVQENPDLENEQNNMQNDGTPTQKTDDVQPDENNIENNDKDIAEKK